MNKLATSVWPSRGTSGNDNETPESIPDRPGGTNGNGTPGGSGTGISLPGNNGSGNGVGNGVGEYVEEEERQ